MSRSWVKVHDQSQKEKGVAKVVIVTTNDAFVV